MNQNWELAGLLWLPNRKMGWLLKDCFSTARSIYHAFCKQTIKPISTKTVSRRLNKEKLVAWIPCCKPLISKKNQKVRLNFTTEHILWTEEQWNMVHFSDESKFNLFGSDVKRFVRCKNREQLSPQWTKKTVKFGLGSVMVWEMISSVGVGPIVHFHGNINASVYKKNFFACMLFLIYAKGQLKLQYLCKTTHLATKLKLC